MLGVDLRILAGTPAVAYRTAALDFSPYVAVSPASLTPTLQLGATNDCDADDDVLDIPIVGPQPWSYYGSGSSYLSGVRYRPAGKNYESIVDGFDLKNLLSPYGANAHRRLAYLFELVSWINGYTGCRFIGDPCGSILGIAGGPAVRDYLALRNTPLRSGWATVHLGLARADRVRVRIYDIAGRQVRVLADRAFDAGEHDLRWDGSDDAGVRLSNGIYFARATYASSGFTDAKRVVVLH